MSDPTLPPSSPLGYESSGMMTESDPAQRSQAMIAHLLGILGILGTGIYYLIKKNDPTAGPFVKDQMKEAFNFQLTLFIVYIVLQILIAVIVGVTHSAILALLLGLAMFAIAIGSLVLVILNALKANKGIAARYPFKIAVLK